MPHKTVQKRKTGPQTLKKEETSVEDVEAEKKASCEKTGLPEEAEKSAAPSKDAATLLETSSDVEKPDKLEEAPTSVKTGKSSTSGTSSEKDKTKIGHRSSRRTKYKEGEGEADVLISDDDNKEHEACASSDKSGAKKASKSQSKETSNTAGKGTSGKRGRPPKRKTVYKEEPEAIELSDDGDSEKKSKRAGKGTSKAGASTTTDEVLDVKANRKRGRGKAEAPSVRKSNRSKQATNYIEIDISDEEKEVDEVVPELEKTKPLKKRKKELQSKHTVRSKKNDPVQDESSDDLEVLSENICKSTDELVVLSENISNKKGRRRSSRSPKVLRLEVSNRPSRNKPIKRYTEIDEDSDE